MRRPACRRRVRRPGERRRVDRAKIRGPTASDDAGLARHVESGRGRLPAGASATSVDADPDVLIIGAGASGAVAAKRLAEAGFRVVCLEQGDWPDHTKARADHPDYELTAGRDWGWDPNVRGAAADYPIDETESDITALMWNGVGGGTVVYAAHWQRNFPSDFAVPH